MSATVNMAAVEAANQHLKELDRLRKEQDTVIRKINKIHSKLAQTTPETAERYGDKLWFKLRDFYAEAKTLAESEESVSNYCIAQLDILISPSQAATHRRKPDNVEPKRKRLKSENDTSKLNSPTNPTRMPADSPNISIGDQVAARVTSDGAEKDEWIVVKVIRFDRETNKYEVIDEEPGDDEEAGQSSVDCKKYKLHHTAIIPLPKKNDPSTAQDFGHGSQVLAVYPGTTALYKATVVAQRKRKTDDYSLEFDDDEEEGCDVLPKRPVPFYHVVQLPQGHRQ